MLTVTHGISCLPHAPASPPCPAVAHGFSFAATSLVCLTSLPPTLAVVNLLGTSFLGERPLGGPGAPGSLGKAPTAEI